MEKNIAQQIVSRYGLTIAVMSVFLLFVVDIFFVFAENMRTEGAARQETRECQSYGGEDASMISKINGAGITEQAASSVCKTKSPVPCSDLGEKVWVLLLLSYVFLLLFNLGYGMWKGAGIQWGMEAILTAVFVLFWFSYDSCARNLWYPLYVSKLGIAIYIAYIYFFFNKKNTD